MAFFVCFQMVAPAVPDVLTCIHTTFLQRLFFVANTTRHADCSATPCHRTKIQLLCRCQRLCFRSISDIQKMILTGSYYLSASPTGDPAHSPLMYMLRHLPLLIANIENYHPTNFSFPCLLTTAAG